MAVRPPPRIFAPTRRRSAWLRALTRQAAPDAARFVEEAVVEDMIERLQFTRLAPPRSLVIGELGHALSDYLSITGDVVRVDPFSFDEERPLDSGPFDFIANLGTLATVNDLPGALLHLRAGLAPDGLLMVSLVGAGSLTHLRGAMIAAEPDRAAPRMHPAIDTRSATALLERAGFAGSSWIAGQFRSAIARSTGWSTICGIKPSAISSRSPDRRSLARLWKGRARPSSGRRTKRAGLSSGSKS